VAELPQETGVYFFYSKEGELLYIGKATNLRSRVSSYFRTDSKLPASTAGGRNENESTNKNAVNANMRIANSGNDANLRIKHLEQVEHLQHLEPSIVRGRSQWIGRMVGQVEEIKFEQTDSVLEALILESNLIKKHQPKYNTLEKDDKSFAYFVITKEEFPRVLIVRKTDIEKVNSLNSMSLRGGTPPKQSRAMLRSGSPRIFEYKNPRDDSNGLKAKKLTPEKLQATFGPYTSKQQMEIALKIMRRIFPFHAGKQKTEKGCLDFQLGTCPGPYADAISKVDYQKNINGIKLILAGKKKKLLKDLEKEMRALAKLHEFEKAAQVRNKIFALQHIRDVALITREMANAPSPQPSPEGRGSHKEENFRIEAYDISNISGTDAVGSMVVFSARGESALGGENWQPNKSEYRKFKIKTVVGSNDVAMMKEVLLRRFKNDWPMPDLILLDGGAGHVNMADELLHAQLGLAVSIVGVAKGPTRKNLKFEIRNLKLNQEIQSILQDKLLIKQIMDEAHRFAISFHRKLRGKSFLK